MSIYRPVNTRVWADPTYRSFGLLTQHLWLYLLTNDHSHISGLYRLPDALGAYDMGVEVEKYQASLQELVDAEMVQRDDETAEIWVVNALSYQAHTPNNLKAAVSQVDQVHSESLAEAFLERYRALLQSKPKAKRKPSGSHQEGKRKGSGSIADKGSRSRSEGEEEVKDPVCVDSDSSTQGGPEAPTEDAHTQDFKNPEQDHPPGCPEQPNESDRVADSEAADRPPPGPSSRPQVPTGPPGGAVAHAQARHRGPRPPQAMVPPDPCRWKDGHEHAILLELQAHHAQLFGTDPPPKIVPDDHLRRVLEAVRTFGLAACERMQLAHHARCKADPELRWRAWSDAYPFQRKHRKPLFDALDYDRARALVEEGRAIQQRIDDPLAGHRGR